MPRTNTFVRLERMDDRIIPYFPCQEEPSMSDCHYRGVRHHQAGISSQWHISSTLLSPAAEHREIDNPKVTPSERYLPAQVDLGLFLA